MIFVDELEVRGQWRYGASSHLMPQSSAPEHLEELHTFAQRIGLKREWFQAGRWPHYDVNGSKRAQAVRAGAVEVTTRQYIIAARSQSTAQLAAAQETTHHDPQGRLC